MNRPGTTSRRIATGAALAAIGGLALCLAFPPAGWWPLVFVGFVPMLIAQHRVLPAAWAGMSPAIGLAGYLGYLTWGALLGWQRPLLLLLIPALWAAGTVERKWHERTGFRHLWWAGPVTWAGGLFAVGRTPLASWADPAYALYRQPWLIQPVSVFGLYGLDLVIMLSAYGVAASFIVGPSRDRRRLRVGVVALLVAWSIASVALLDAGREGPSVRVAALQPGLTNNSRSPAAHAAANNAVLRRLTTDTRRAAAAGAKLIVWPEKALVDFDPHTDDTRALQSLARATGAYLVIAYTPDPARYNRATVLAPDGQFIAEYDKQHAVTFQDDHSIGGPVSVAATAIGRLAPIICYDLDFDDTARSAARAHAELLAVPSLDWSGIAELHYSHLVFRAVENRLAAVKADAAWDSAIVDPEGRIVRSHVSRHASRAMLVATVPLGTGHSPFVAVGDVVAWASVVLACVWLGIGSGPALTRIVRASPRDDVAKRGQLR